MATTDNGRQNLEGLFSDGARPNGDDLSLLIGSFVNRYDGISADEIGELLTGDGNTLNVRLDYFDRILQTGSDGLEVRPASSEGDQDVALLPEGDGNVGLMTSSPAFDVHVQRKDVTLAVDGRAGNTYGCTGQLSLFGARNTDGMVFGKVRFNNYDNNHTSEDLGGVELRAERDGNGGAALVLATAQSGTLSDQVRVGKDGNVGIGTNGAKNLLDVSGGALVGSGIAGTVTAPTDGLVVEGDVWIGVAEGNETVQVVGTVAAGTTAEDYVQIGYDGADAFVNGVNAGHLDLQVDGDTKVAISGDGNMGVGTDVTTEKLQVLGNAGIGSSTTDYLKVGHDGSAGFIDQPNALPFEIRNGGAAQLTLDDAGNLGLGTASPETNLELYAENAIFRINGRAAADDNRSSKLQMYGANNNDNLIAGLEFFNYNYTDESPADEMIAKISVFTEGSGSALQLRTMTSGSMNDGLYLDDLGNVSIGTTTSEARLTIKGNGGITLRVAGNTHQTGVEWMNAGQNHEWRIYRDTREGESSSKPSLKIAGGSTQTRSELTDYLEITNDGDFLFKGAKPIEVRRYTNISSNASTDTGYSTANYTAAVVGFRADDVNLMEGLTDGTFIQVYMFQQDSKWYLKTDLASEYNHETWTVHVMFISTQLSFATNY